MDSQPAALLLSEILKGGSVKTPETHLDLPLHNPPGSWTFSIAWMSIC